MKLIPNHYYSTSSNAEKKIFDILRNLKSDITVFHSLNLPSHIAHQRTGEIDFLLLSEDGLFILEIKGGRLVCEQGTWKTIDRNDVAHALNKSPFRQAEDAMHTLEQKIYATFPDLALKKCIFGYGVVTPDCCIDIVSEEWDPELYAGQTEVRNFGKWLDKLVAYWRQKTPHVPKLSKPELSNLSKFLRPDFEAGVNLFSESQDINQKIQTFTDEQMLFLDAIDSNDRVLIKGGAGTGKTFLSLELAKRLSSPDTSIGFLCFSPWLKNFLTTFDLPDVYFMTPESINLTLRRNDLEKFDILIVDEGQDLLNITTLDRMDKIIDGGLGDGKWYFFYDPNHQSNLIGSYSEEAERLLLSYSPMQISLKKNCRNTNQILKKLTNVTGIHDIESRNIDGPAVMNIEKTTDLQDFLTDFLSDNPDFSVQDIIILGPKNFPESSAFQARNGKVHIYELDAFSGQNSYHGIGYATISNYKGLESNIVILIDTDQITPENRLNYLYVGITRARVLLIIER